MTHKHRITKLFILVPVTSLLHMDLIKNSTLLNTRYSLLPDIKIT